MNLGQTVITKILADQRVDLLLKIEPEYFQEEFERPIFLFVRQYYTKYATLPPLSIVKDKFKLDAEISEGTVDYWVGELEKRKFMLTYEEGINTINPHIGSGNLEAARVALLDLCMRLSHVGDAVRHPRPLKDLFGESINGLPDRRAKGGIVGIPCPWDGLNRLLRGFTAGNIYIIAGRKKLGKSEIMAIMSYHAAVIGETPLMISMEMMQEEYVNRILSLHSGVGLNYLISGRVSTETERNLRQSIESMNIPYYFQEGFFRTSVADLDLLTMMHKPTVVFIDGAYLLKPPAGTAKMAGWERVAETIKEIKIMAGKHKIPIVLSYQFNKEGDVHLSDSIRQICTAALGMYIPQHRNDQRIIRVIDNRNGTLGEITINWDFDRVDFQQVAFVDDGRLGDFFEEGN